MTAPEVPGPTVEAIRALARASRLLERASGEVNLAHYRVLAAIASGDQRASRIAAKLALGKPTVSASVESLCKRGLLARSGVQGDQRAASLQLTSEGKKWLARRRRPWRCGWTTSAPGPRTRAKPCAPWLRWGKPSSKWWPNVMPKENRRRLIDNRATR